MNAQVKNAAPQSLLPQQLEAAHTDQSVWVAASAGTGKTKVLTDRVLRLLLPRGDGQQGTPPSKLLCVTFTNAAAAEMVERVLNFARKWLHLSDEDLHAELSTLFGAPATDLQIAAARQLFAHIVDAPGGLKIMTLHAFGQSVLRRFPLEAGIAPGFTLLTEREIADMLAAAQDHVFEQALSAEDAPLHDVIHRLLTLENADRLQALTTHVRKEQQFLLDFFAQHPSRNMQVAMMNDALGIPPDAEDIISRYWQSLPQQRPLWQCLCDEVASMSGAHAAKLAAAVNAVLSLHDDDWVNADHLLGKIFLTNDGDVSSQLATVAGKCSAANADFYATARERLLAIRDLQSLLNMRTATLDLLTLSHAILQRYTAQKRSRNALDFDDQILHTRRLLENGAIWVRYKLDQGIDHILLDEAQDTNPDQWGIIDALVDEFFAGEGAREGLIRTVFTVGDEKQSIYGFQRANPDKFGTQHDKYRRHITGAAQRFVSVSLDRSFRSGPAVLHAVDAVMALPQVRDNLISGREDIRHVPHRSEAPGRVELWPLCEDAGGEDLGPWPVLRDRAVARSGTALLVERIVSQIQSWIGHRPLPGKNRKVAAGDILILLRKRSDLQHMLVRALRQAGVPVSGLDRLELHKFMPVQDLLQLAMGALQPRDDLRLAGVLKSPFIRLTEEALFTLAYGREDTPLMARLRQQHPSVAAWLDGVSALAEGHATPYAFFRAVLTRPCPQGHSGMFALLQGLGPDSEDVIDTFLNIALDRGATQPDLLTFCRELQLNPPEIKRQLAPGGDNAVTIMTAHSAKGLQAPIVILPDTAASKTQLRGGSKPEQAFLWGHETGLPVPIWGARDARPGRYKDARAVKDARDDAEYRRLLYVALTRAEDELYICGAKPSQEMSDRCWYAHCRAGMEALETSPPQGLDLHRRDDGTLVLEKTVTLTPATPDVTLEEAPQATSPDLPSWVREKARNRIFSGEVVRPSQLGSFEPAALSPLAGRQDYRFERGRLTHTLLQFLPDIPPAGRDYAIRQFLDTRAGDVPAEIKASIAGEVGAILGNQDFAALFGPASRAEVPISGVLPGGELVSGQIDRLAVLPDRILLLDFKTNRPPPQSPDTVPDSYVQQLKTYKALLSQIYPGRDIACYLLWTDGARLMPIAA